MHLIPVYLYYDIYIYISFSNYVTSSLRLSNFVHKIAINKNVWRLILTVNRQLPTGEFSHCLVK